MSANLGPITQSSSSAVDQRDLQLALDSLQATAANFAATCIKDAKVRAQYMRDVGAIPTEYMRAVRSGRMTARVAAESACNMRNQILELSRLRSSPTGRAYAASMKRNGLTLGKLAEKHAFQLFGQSFSSLTEVRQAEVYLKIVNAAGRGNLKVAVLARTLGKAGRRLVLVSLGVAVYEIYLAEDKPREIVRQGAITSAGVAGGWAAGVGAVTTGACAATAPICVGIAALIGGVLFAFGTDLIYGTIYPLPARR